MPVPQFYQKIQENKWTFGILAFFLGNMISQSLLSTGAFEIYINNDLVFSKLQTGRMPDVNTINAIFRTAGLAL